MKINGTQYEILTNFKPTPKLETIQVRGSDGRLNFIDRPWVKLYSDVTFSDCDLKIQDLRTLISTLNGGIFTLTQEGEDVFAPNIQSSIVSCRFIKIISDEPVWQGYSNLTVRIAVDRRVTTPATSFPDLDYPPNNSLRVSPELINGASIENVREGVLIESNRLEYRASLSLSRDQMATLLDFYYNQRHAVFSYPLNFNIFDSSSSTLPTSLQIVELNNITRKTRTRWGCSVVFQGVQ